MRKPWRVWLFYWVPAFEAVQKPSLGYAGGKPNPLNPPYQGDFPLNSPLIRGTFHSIPPLIRGTFHSIPPLIRGTFHSIPPLIRGARGVKNDERWVSGTVSLWRIASLCHWRAEQGAESFVQCFGLLNYPLIGGRVLTLLRECFHFEIINGHLY